MQYSQTEILILIDEKLKLERRLESLVYGSVEIRVKDSKKYIYVHYRKSGIHVTKYVGEFSDSLYDLILKNNLESKQIKRELRRILKELKKNNYVESELEPRVQMNIDYARKSMVDSIYKQSVLEGIDTTYVDTETILEGGKISNMSPDDIRKIVNLKHAWQLILNSYVISSPTNFMLLSEINKLIIEGFYYNAGKVRSVPVSIGGTTWKPAIPIESVVKEELNEILTSSISTVEKAVEVLLYVMKKQVFIDGNKRTAVLYANHLLIANAEGLIVIPTELVAEFRELLIQHYEGKDMKAIKTFLINKCYTKI